MAAAAGVGLAGCSGGDEYPEGVDPEEAREHYEGAIADLVENQDTLGDWAAGRPGRDQGDIDSLRSNLERARGSLDSAADVAPEDMSARIVSARDVATFQASLVDFYELTIEFQETSADAAAFGDAEQHERAVETYESAAGILDEARSQLEEVRAAHEQLDTSPIDEPELDYRGEYTEFVDVEGPGSIDAQELMVDGQRNLHELFVELNAGFERYQNEEFVAARERFNAGEEARQRAEDAYRAVQAHEFAWQSLREQSINLLGIVEDLAEALELFVDATHEAEAGNPQEANELAEEGFFVLEQAFE